MKMTCSFINIKAEPHIHLTNVYMGAIYHAVQMVLRLHLDGFPPLFVLKPMQLITSLLKVWVARHD